MTRFVTKRISALFLNDKHENDNEKDYYNDRIVPLIDTTNTDNHIRMNTNANYKKKKKQKNTNRSNNEYNSHSNITTNEATTRGGGGGLLPVLLGILIGSIVFCITQLISSYFYHSFYQNQSLFLPMNTNINMNSPPLLLLSSSTTNNNNPPHDKKIGTWWLIYEEFGWNELPDNIREAAITLGYNILIWERGEKKPESIKKRWKELNSAEQQAAGVLGYIKKTWNHEGLEHQKIMEQKQKQLIYEEVAWNDLPENIREAAITLGYNILIWEKDEEEPESGEKIWKELNSAEQQAAGVLGYTKKTWNHEGLENHKIMEPKQKQQQQQMQHKKKKKPKNNKQQQQQQQIKQPKKQGPSLRQPQPQHQQQQQQQQTDKQHQQQQQHQNQRPHRLHYFEFWKTLQASLEGDHDLIMAKSKEIPPSFVYYRNQSHHEQEEGDNNEKVLSSLEILRQILRSGKHKSADEYYQHNFGEGEKSDRDRSNSNSNNTNTKTNDELRTLLPQCLQPNLSSSKKIAKLIMQQRRSDRRHHDKKSSQRQPLLQGPILNMGFPEMGSTSTLVDFFRCAGSTSISAKSSSSNNNLCAGTHTGNTIINNGHRYQVTQSQRGSGNQQLMESLVLEQDTNNNPVRPFDIYPHSGNAMNNYHRDPLDEKRQGNPNLPLHKNNDPVTVVHLQLEQHNKYNGQGSYPQIQLLDEMHTQEPNSVFLLSFRPVQEWIQSINNSLDGPRGRSVPLRARLSNSNLPGLETTQEQRNQQQQWSEGHPQSKKKKKNNNQLFGFQNTMIVPPTELQLVRWWCGHVLHLREYIKLYPSHTLIEFEFDSTTTTTTTTTATNEKNKKNAHDHKNEKDHSMDSETTTSQILGDIFDIDYSCWNHCNKDAKEEEEEEEENKKRKQKRREHKRN